jgi:hypothetical protein
MILFLRFFFFSSRLSSFIIRFSFLDAATPLDTFGPHVVNVKLGTETDAVTGSLKIVINERKIGVDRSRFEE